MDDLIRQVIRGGFVEASVYFYAGAVTQEQLDDIEMLARDYWALRTEDDA